MNKLKSVILYCVNTSFRYDHMWVRGMEYSLHIAQQMSMELVDLLSVMIEFLLSSRCAFPVFPILALTY